MFLSRLFLDPRNRQARVDLGRPYEMHRTLWRAFPEGNPGRILFRVDADRQGRDPFVLVQSEFLPRWENVTESEPHYVLAQPECKEFEPSFAVGLRLRFRLRANPTKKVGSLLRTERLGGTKEHAETSKNGRRVAIFGEEAQIGWLIQKGEAGGFRIPGEWLGGVDGHRSPNFRVDAVPDGWARCDKDGHAGGRLYSVRFEGLLEVTAPDVFLQTIRDGLGSAKGFGFGLLSVAPPAGG